MYLVLRGVTREDLEDKLNQYSEYELVQIIPENFYLLSLSADVVLQRVIVVLRKLED